MAETTSCMETNSSVAVQEVQEPSLETHSTVKLKLRKPKTTKRVAWTNETVDNEHMNKKKSKCCCIYEKPRTFGESSSDTDDECEHCCGHTDSKKQTQDSSKPEAGDPSGAEGT